MKRTVIIMIILSFVSRFSGFLREVFMAWRFGATLQTDTYIAAMTIPVMVMSFITAGLSSSLIPVLAVAQKKGKEQVFFNRLLSVFSVIAIVLMLMIIILARPLNLLVVRGFTPDEIGQVVYYSRLMSVITIFQILSYSFMGYLQHNNRFFIAATVGIPMNLGIIAGAVFTRDPSTIMVLVLGTIIGYILQMVWVLHPLIRMKFPFRFDFNLSDEHFKLLFALIVPVIITSSAHHINGIINRSIASGLEEGSISLLNYAQKVNGLFYQSVVVTLSTVLFTRQAKLSSEKDWQGIFKVTRENLSSVMMLIVPLMLGTMFLSTQVMQLIFQRGAFTAEDSIRGGMVLLLYSPSLMAMSTNELLSKMFFSLQQSKKPMIATIINISINIGLSFLLYQQYGINGLAVAATIASLTGIFILSLMARKQFRQTGVAFWTNSYLKYLLAGGLMIAVLFGFKSLPLAQKLSVMSYTLFCGIIGAITYFIGLYVTKTAELLKLMQQLKNRFKRS